MLVEWIIGKKFNPDLKGRSSLAIVQWAFSRDHRPVRHKGERNRQGKYPDDRAVLYVAITAVTLISSSDIR